MQFFSKGFAFFLFVSAYFLFLNPAHAQLGPLKDLFFDSEPTLEVPLGQLNDMGAESRWIKPSIGYEFQFANYPGDPSRFLMRETLNFRLRLPLSLHNSNSVSLGPKFEAEFIRPFTKSPLPSLDEMTPYGPQKAPHSDGKALALKSGDFYSFTTEMAFELSASTAQLKGIAFLGLNASYIISGDFRVDVYRLSGSKVKVVASSLRQKSVGFGVEAKTVPDIEVFGFGLANQLLNNQLRVQVMDWDIYQRYKGNLFSVSYTYDLAEQEGRESYNQLMNLNHWKNINLNVTNMGGRSEELSSRNFWVADLSYSRQYAPEDFPGVVQHNESELDFVTRSSGIEFDIRLANRNRQRNFMEIDYQIRKGPEDPVSRYRIASFTLDRDYQIGINLWEKEVSKEALMIMSLDRDSKITGLDELTFHFERSDKKLKVQRGLFAQNELPSFYGQLRKMLPESMHYPYLYQLEEHLKTGWNKGTYVAMDLAFNPEAFQLMQTLSNREIDQVFDNFVNQVIETQKADNNRFFGDLELQGSLNQHLNAETGTLESFFSEKKTENLKKILHYVFHPATDQEMLEKQWVYFRSLKNSMIFRDLGAGIMVRLLERAGDKNKIPFNELLKFQVEYKADGEDRIFFSAGDYLRPDYTKALLRDRDRVLNRRYNPWHFEESNQ